MIIDIHAPFPNVYARINTPIQDYEDREVLWEGIRDGTVECIGTDHIAAKKAMFDENNVWGGTSHGIASMQLILPLMITEGYYKRGIPLERIVQICSYNNAKRFGIYPRKGTIEVGSDADLVVVDINRKKTVRVSDWPMGFSDFCIYEDRELQGWPSLTMLRGKIVSKDGKILGSPTGKYIYQEMGANK